MLTKISYRKVVQKLEFFRKQHERDRKENPDLLPCSWGSSIKNMIEQVAKENHEKFVRGTTAEQTINHLIKVGLLVEYCGDVTFPGEELPTKEQIEQEALRLLDKRTS